MTKDTVYVAIIAVFVVIAGVLFFNPPIVERTVERVVGGSSVGPEHQDHQVFRQGATLGGNVVATSTSNSGETLLASDIASTRGQYTSWIKFTPLAANATLTLPATSTLKYFIPNPGDHYSIIVENAATAATTTTIAAGAGMDLQEPDGQNVVIGQNNYAIITFWRDSTTDMVVTVDEHIPAD